MGFKMSVKRNSGLIEKSNSLSMDNRRIWIGCDCLLSWLLQIFLRFFWSEKTPSRSLQKSMTRWKRPLVLRLLKVFSARFRGPVGQATTGPVKGAKKSLTFGRVYIHPGCNEVNEVPSCVNESEKVHFSCRGSASWSLRGKEVIH